MIDLVSTREGVDPQTRACANLIAAVISQALQDLCIKPSPEEAHMSRNTNFDARASVDFFFGKSNGSRPMVDAYARLIGLDGDAIREAIMSDRKLKDQPETRAFAFRPHERRIAQARARWR